MSRVEDLERAIESLSPDELAQFREWFATFDWQMWDRQLDRDVARGALDSLANEAIRDHEAGQINRHG